MTLFHIMTISFHNTISTQDHFIFMTLYFLV